MCKPLSSSKANVDPVKTPNVDAPNPFDSTLAASINASLVAGVKEPKAFKQEYFEPLFCNPGITISS
jgi:hypothetical protein